MRKLFLLLPLLFIAACDNSPETTDPAPKPDQNPVGKPKGPSVSTPPEKKLTLLEARKRFETEITKEGESAGPPDVPPEDSGFELISYESPVGELAAYVTKDPGDGNKHPAIVWITGGDNNSIGDVWSPYERENDQSASAFRNAGIVMMFPSQRGGNENPGKREGFLGESDDILAATDHLEKLPYVDPGQIYLGGHSTGGTMVLLVAACSDRYKGVFSLGPVSDAAHYGGELVYCNPYSMKEMWPRAPKRWLHCIASPTYVFEGAVDGNWGSIEEMVRANDNEKVKFFKVDGHDHFSVIAPVAELLAEQIVSGKVEVKEADLKGLK